MRESFILTWPIVAFVLFWVGTSLVVGRLSGWAQLAKAFPVWQKPHGDTFRFQTIRLNWSRYKNSITIRIGREGIYIAVNPLFRIGHRPFLIPWQAVTHKEQDLLLGFTRGKLHIKNSGKVKEITVDGPVISQAKLRGYI